MIRDKQAKNAPVAAKEQTERRLRWCAAAFDAVGQVHARETKAIGSIKLGGVLCALRLPNPSLQLCLNMRDILGGKVIRRRGSYEWAARGVESGEVARILIPYSHIQRVALTAYADLRDVIAENRRKKVLTGREDHENLDERRAFISIIARTRSVWRTAPQAPVSDRSEAAWNDDTGVTPVRPNYGLLASVLVGEIPAVNRPALPPPPPSVPLSSRHVPLAPSTIPIPAAPSAAPSDPSDV